MANSTIDIHDESAVQNETTPHLKRLFDLTGKVVLITGGAGQLAGQFAEGFAEAGAELVLTDVREDLLNLRCRDYGQRNLKASSCPAELTDPNSVSQLFERINDEFGRLDILVNNGGKTTFVAFEETEPEEFLEVLDVHLKGSFMMVQNALPLMKRQGGSIINIGSIYGMVGADQRIYGDSGINSSSAYAAAKGGMISFTRYLASYLSEYNIRVNCISPGGFYAGQDPAFVKNYCRNTLLGRMGDDHDLKGVGVFLASDAAKYITGVNLPVDGGWTVR